VCLTTVSAHPILFGVVAAATAGFGAFGLATGAGLTVPYVIVVVGVAGGLVRLDRRVGFSPVVAVGFAAWGVAHLAGGLIGISGDRVLYNAVLAPHVRYDNVVHFFGFGVAGVACWETLRTFVSFTSEPSARAAGLTVWLFGMGVGAVNEVVEFFVSQIVEDSNVGGYQNTGRDLVANLLGAAAGALLVSRRRRAPDVRS